MDAKQQRNEFPRVYQVDPRIRNITTGFGVSLVGLGVLMCGLHLSGVTKTPFRLGDVVGVVLFSTFALWISERGSQRVVLDVDSIELVTWFGRRKLVREEIRGYRIGGTSTNRAGAQHYVIVPIDHRVKALKLPPGLKHDKRWFAWMRSIPHLSSS